MNNYDPQPSSRDSAYNLNLANIVLIGDLQREAFILSNKGRSEQAYLRWQSIRLLIENRFEDDERRELDELEEEFEEPLVVDIPKSLKGEVGERKTTFTRSPKQTARIRFLNDSKESVQRKNLANYIKCIMRFMRKYKMDLGDKEKRVKLS